MHDVPNDYWTAKAGRFISVAQVERLARRYRREMKLAQWEKGNRRVRCGSRLVLAYKVPGTPEAGQRAMQMANRERYIAATLKIRLA